jgi:hypothetical protein
MAYQITYSGLASTPDAILVKKTSTNEVVEKVQIANGFITGKQQREVYKKEIKRLKEKYDIHS